jgi:pantothenate synthetase
MQNKGGWFLHVRNKKTVRKEEELAGSVRSTILARKTSSLSRDIMNVTKKSMKKARPQKRNHAITKKTHYVPYGKTNHTPANGWENEAFQI